MSIRARLMAFSIAALSSVVAHADDRATKAAIADYALWGALENLAVLSYLENGKAAELPALANINLQKHLTALRESSDGISDPTWIAAKVRTINAIGLVWEQAPPRTDMTFSGDLAPEIREGWIEQIKANKALVEWAFKECRAHPEYACKTKDR